jgi:hypothetical protein
MHPRNIDRIGWWALRCVVALGGVVLACMGHEEAASTCGALVFISLFLGD